MKEYIRPGSVHLDFLEVKDEKYRIEGFVLLKDNAGDGMKIMVRTSKGESQAIFVRRPIPNIIDEVDKVTPFVVDGMIATNDSLRFFIEMDTSGKQILKIHTGRFTQISPLKYSFRNCDGSLIRNMKYRLAVRPSSHIRAAWYELSFWLRLIAHWRVPNVMSAARGIFQSSDRRSPKKVLFEIVKPFLIIAESIVTLPQAYLLRIQYYAHKNRQHKPIWLISDRGMAAGDNGEALFRYIKQRKDVPAEVYFVLSKKSSDFKRLQGIGEVIDQDSHYYKLLFLLADKVISSHADIEVTNPFLRQRYHFQDLMKHDFVFLQHGIIRHDHSSWLNKYEKNIDVFITSAQKEYQSILTHNYGYDEKQVALTGLPRFDLLENSPKGKIILAPTYRRELARIPTDKNGARAYDAEFKKSEYFATYSRLLSDKSLLQYVKEKNMTIDFYLHPNFSVQHKDFDSSDIVSIKQYPYSYKEAFRDGNLLITDYSSASFDFVYLKKPMIYYQFDKETFYNHSFSVESDFFSDEKDGFGPVVDSHEELISQIKEIIESNCEMDSIYKQRVDEFFYKIDSANSARVYDAIINHVR